jgi:hypothetical protein
MKTKTSNSTSSHEANTLLAAGAPNPKLSTDAIALEGAVVSRGNGIGATSKHVSVLFARQDSIYKTLGVDVWDIERDARNFTGTNAVVCHPPCRAWGQLRHFAKPRPDEKKLAIYSIDLIRCNGGVLEHPRASSLWQHMNLPIGNQVDEFGGYTLSVNQSWWGHKAEKKTLLYVCGCPRAELPPTPIRFDLITHVVSNEARKGQPGYKPRITQYEREATPLEMAKWLIEVAALCQKTN